VTDLAPWSADLHWALAEAQLAPHTHRITEIAIELFKRLKDFEPEPKGDGDEEGDGEGDEEGDDQDGDGQGNKPTEGDDQDGDKGGKGDGNPTDKPTDGDDDKGGQEGEKGSEGGDQPTDEGNPKPSKKNGAGKDFSGGRNVEPTEFIEGELNDQKSELSKRLDNRPSSAKPTYATFEWR
jgi:hypothetical protein